MVCCDYINHVGYHIKEKKAIEGTGAAMLKRPGENTALSPRNMPNIIKKLSISTPPSLIRTCILVEMGVQFIKLFGLSGEVLQEVVSRLKKTRFPVDLGSLARVEEMIVDKFGAPSFDSLGNGSFLGFVASHDKACEALGGRLIGTNSSSSRIAGVKRKVMSIIQQLKLDRRDDQVCYF